MVKPFCLRLVAKGKGTPDRRLDGADKNGWREFNGGLEGALGDLRAEHRGSTIKITAQGLSNVLARDYKTTGSLVLSGGEGKYTFEACRPGDACMVPCECTQAQIRVHPPIAPAGPYQFAWQQQQQQQAMFQHQLVVQQYQQMQQQMLQLIACYQRQLQQQQAPHLLQQGPALIGRLESIAFEWGVTLSAEWDKKFNELVAYKDAHGGSCNVPQRYAENPQLGKWVGRQRTQYKKFQQDPSTSHMTQERIERLESIGFEWNGRSLKTNACLSEEYDDDNDDDNNDDEEEEEEEEEEEKEESKVPSLSIKSRFNSEPTLKKRVTCKEERQVLIFPSFEPWIKKRRINL